MTWIRYLYKDVDRSVFAEFQDVSGFGPHEYMTMPQDDCPHRWTVRHQHTHRARPHRAALDRVRLELPFERLVPQTDDAIFSASHETLESLDGTAQFGYYELWYNERLLIKIVLLLQTLIIVNNKSLVKVFPLQPCQFWIV